MVLASMYGSSALYSNPNADNLKTIIDKFTLLPCIKAVPMCRMFLELSASVQFWELSESNALEK
jgi:hypothetical protein